MMKSSEWLSSHRSRCAALILGLAVSAVPIAGARGQEPTTKASAEAMQAVEPFAPTQTPQDVPGELEMAKPAHGALIDVGIEDVFPQSFKDGRAELKDKYGLEFGFAYTAVFQQASGGPGERNAAGGDVDIFGTWRVIGTPENNAGTLVWAADNRHALFTDLTPGELGPSMGTLFDTTDGFGERSFALRQLFWEQKLLDNKLVLSAGKIDAGNYYNGSRGSNDNTLALNKALSANPARFFPQEGIGFNAKVIPDDMYFVSAGVHDFNADGEQTGLNTMGDGRYFYAGEFGLTPLVKGELEGIYRFAAWYNDASDRFGADSGWGIGLSVTQFITKTTGVAVRYGWQNADDVEVEQVLSAQYLSFVGGSRFKDVWGVGAGWGRPSDGDLRDEYIAEVFYRIQLTRNMQLTPDFQVIANPSNSPDDDVIGVFGLRVRTAF